MVKFDPHSIKWLRVLHSESYYGVVWEASFNDIFLAVKMVLLSSGIHFDLAQQKYLKGHKPISGLVNCFDQNGEMPYFHDLFKQRRSMSHTSLQREAANLQHMYELGLGPVLYGAWTEKMPTGIRYGFIAMERVDYSLKEVIARRVLSLEEKALVKTQIDRMHHKYKLVHGDMKPSNLGVFLDRKARLSRCVLLDCSKIRSKKELGSSAFKKVVERDWVTFHKHGGSVK